MCIQLPGQVLLHNRRISLFTIQALFDMGSTNEQKIINNMGIMQTDSDLSMCQFTQVSTSQIHTFNGNIILCNYGNIHKSGFLPLSVLARVCCQSQDNTCLQVSHYCSPAVLGAGRWSGMAQSGFMHTALRVSKWRLPKVQWGSAASSVWGP